MPRVFVSLGSNIDREHHIRTCLRELGERFGTLAVSPVYESAAVGFVGACFLNLVVAFETGEPVEAVEDVLGALERDHGRSAGHARYASRTLDLDVLLYGDLRRADPRHPLPRPEILEQPFVLKPLTDLAPDLCHPETGETFGAHWRTVSDDSPPLRVTDLRLQAK